MTFIAVKVLLTSVLLGVISISAYEVAKARGFKRLASVANWVFGLIFTLGIGSLIVLIWTAF